MSTEATLVIRSTSSNETEKLAEQIGHNLRGGETIELISDLGGGKTTFVRGLAKGMGSTDNVASPTFTISREYKAGDLTLHHFDFYRLPQAGIVAHELAEFLDDKKAVTVIEWANIIHDVLPEKRLRIQFQTDGETTRKLEFMYDIEQAYVVKGVA